ncbi:unnamed protein product, partial [Allacma fusca]
AGFEPNVFVCLHIYLHYCWN